MGVQQVPDQISASDIEAAANCLEQMLLRDGQHASKSLVRRAVAETAAAFQLEHHGDWWQWIVEAGQSLGRSCRIVEGNLTDLVRLTRDGTSVVLHGEGGQNWYLLVPERGRRVSLWSSHGNRISQVGSWRQITRKLRHQGLQGQLRGVTLERSLVSTGLLSGDDGERKPFQRLTALLKAESSDLWVVLVFSLVSGLLTMTTPLAVEALVNTVAFGRFLQPVIVLSLILLVFLLFQAALKGVQTYVVEIIQRRLFARIAADLAFRLPRVRTEAMEGHYPPEMVNRFFDVVTVQKITSQLLLDGITVVLTASVGMMVLAFYHPYLLAFDVVLILLLLFAMFVLGQGAVKTSIKESKAKYAMAAWLEDLARCPTAFRYDGAARFAMDRADHRIYSYLEARRKHFHVLMRQILFMLVLQALASTALLAIGGMLVISGQLSLGQLVAAELIVAIVVGAFAKFGKHIESFYDLLASIDKLGSLLDLPVERADGLLAVAGTTGIVVDRLSCTSGHGEQILHDLTLTIRPGQRIAVCGEGGSGKSLLLDVLFGLREPDSGVVTINDVDLRDIRPAVLRRRIALARDVEVFEGTIAENVHLQRAGISIGDVRRALDVVGLLADVQAFPDGLDEEITSGGMPLRTNQLRRLMIARAIVGTPEVLLIDEVLDGFSDDEAEDILRRILAAELSRSVVVATNRERLRSVMDREISLTNRRRESAEESGGQPLAVH